MNIAQIYSSYTSVLLRGQSDTTKDLPIGAQYGCPITRLDKWVYEPLKANHFLKLAGTSRPMHIPMSDTECRLVSVKKYERPTTSITVYVSNEAEFIAAFNNLKSNTTIKIAPGIYRIQQEKLVQHHFVGLENIVIVGTGAIITGFSGGTISSVKEHQTQAYGLKVGVWKRMNPRNPKGPGSMLPTSIMWTPEEIATSSLLGFMVAEDGQIIHNGESPECKLSNAKSPNLWRWTYCKNVYIEGITFEGYNSVYPNYGALGCIFELQGCANFKLYKCRFDRNGGCILSALTMPKNSAGLAQCDLIWLDRCVITDDDSELTYMGMRHSGHTRFAGGIYFNGATNCSVTNTAFLGTFFGVLDVATINNDYISNNFEGLRNHCIGMHGHGGAGLMALKNTFVKCGNPLPSNEEKSTSGPSFWILNDAKQSGWNGTNDVLVYAGMSGGIAQGNRFGGTSSFDLQLGGLHLYDNNVEVVGVAAVDTIPTTGFSLSNRAFSRLVVDGNRWAISNTGQRTAYVVNHYEEYGKTTALAQNLVGIEWGRNILEWDKVGDNMVFFGNKVMTPAAFSQLLADGKVVTTTTTPVPTTTTIGPTPLIG